MSQDESRTAGSPGSDSGDPGDEGGPAGVGRGGAPGHPVGDSNAVDDGGVDSGVDPGDAFDQAAAQVIEDVYELRLAALFRQLVRTRGHKGAGWVLGLAPRTVAASVQQGMSRRVRDAVEKMLVERDGGARDELEDAVEGLAGQVGGLTTQVAGLEGELREGMKALGRPTPRGCGGWSSGWFRVLPGAEAVEVGCRVRRRWRGLRCAGATPIWLRRISQRTTRRSSATPGPWSGSGGICGKATRVRARAWSGCQRASGFWNWRWPCWRSTG